jgi:hypothetical protein
MKSTVNKKHSKKQWFSLLVVSLLLQASTFAQAEIRLSSDWQSSYKADGSRVPDDQDEVWLLGKAAKAAADKRTAVPPSFTIARYQFPLGFKFHLDYTLFYLQPATYMRKNTPDEVCTPDYSKGSLTYACVEGQRHTQDCHLFFFDKNFTEAGYHALSIKEPYQYFCNAVPAIGVGKKANNELLVTVQYFPIERKLASKVSEIGSGWRRMTILVRVRSENGKLVIEQDDSCLGNPNGYQDIPSARKALARCEH